MLEWIVSGIQTRWPFSKNSDDLKTSEGLVRPLPLAESSKKFVFALRVPNEKSNIVVYLLAAEKLSEKSAADAGSLVRAVRPRAVIAQIDPNSVDEIREEESNLCGDEPVSVPSSWLGVLRGCFLERMNGSEYEKRAGTQVLEAIFGTGFYGHVLAAKQAAKESNSVFLFVESPRSICKSIEMETSAEQVQPQGTVEKKISVLPWRGELSHANSLVANLKNPAVTAPIERSFTKSGVSSIASALQNSLALDGGNAVGSAPKMAACVDSSMDQIQIPSFAEPFYPLLVDLHNVFPDLPAIGTALTLARRMLNDVESGLDVGCEILSEVNKFRFAVEGLRIALMNLARVPLKKEETIAREISLNDLSHEDKCDAVLAHSLKTLAKKSGTVVAIVNVSSISGIRKYWNATLPPDVAEMAEECFMVDETDKDPDVDNSGSSSGKRLVAKPVVAVGAGAATFIGVSSFSKIVPASTIVKVVSLNLPSIVKLGLLHTKRTAAIAVTKFLGPTKFLFPASKSIIPGKMTAAYGLNSPSVMKAVASTEKLRAAAHSIVAYSERSTLSAIRTSFYGIMRKRQGKVAGPAPWVTLACSVAGCAGLITYGDGIECAAESAPAMPSIARLGRGLENLRQSSQVLKQMECVNRMEEIYKLLYSKIKN